MDDLTPELGRSWFCSTRPVDSGRSFLGSILIHSLIVFLLAATQAPQISRAIQLRHHKLTALVSPAPAFPMKKLAVSRMAEPPRDEPRPAALRAPVRVAMAPPKAPVRNAVPLPAPPALAAQAPKAAPKLLAEPLPPMREQVTTGLFAAADQPAAQTKPRVEVQTGAFLASEAVAIQQSKPKLELQTGGFTAVEGAEKVFRAAAKPGAAGFASASAQTRTAPGGAVAAAGFAAAATRVQRTDRAVAASGFAEAVAERSRQQSARATSNGGFVEAVAARPQEPRGTIEVAGFREVVAGTLPKQVAKVTIAEEPASAVSILMKPRPAYTDEARTLKVEGEVLLEVLFSASGKLQILRVVKGLGHGLDESAIRSAAGIRFRPALRNGAPVDSVAIARITFQLAY